MHTRKKIVFRVDESKEVGFGHMSRCKALGIALVKAGAKVSFWCNKIRAVTQYQLMTEGISVVDVPTEDFFLQQDFAESIVVVDGYGFNEIFWQRLIDLRPYRTVSIDDFRNVPYIADLVICYNEGVKPGQFNLAPYTQLLLGGRYLLIKPEILRAASVSRPHLLRRYITIVAGGTNQERWLSKILRNLSESKLKLSYRVISGQKISFQKVMGKVGIKKDRVRFFTNLNSFAMIRMYRRSNLLITPASTSMLEAFSVGCPTISGWIADNQKNSLNFYERHGLIINLGDLNNLSGSLLARASKIARRNAWSMLQKQRSYIANAQTGTNEIINAILTDYQVRTQ